MNENSKHTTDAFRQMLTFVDSKQKLNVSQKSFVFQEYFPQQTSRWKEELLKNRFKLFVQLLILDHFKKSTVSTACEDLVMTKSMYGEDETAESISFGPAIYPDVFNAEQFFDYLVSTLRLSDIINKSQITSLHKPWDSQNQVIEEKKTEFYDIDISPKQLHYILKDVEIILAPEGIYAKSHDATIIQGLLSHHKQTFLDFVTEVENNNYIPHEVFCRMLQTLFPGRIFLRMLQ